MPGCQLLVGKGPGVKHVLLSPEGKDILRHVLECGLQTGKLPGSAYTSDAYEIQYKYTPTWCRKGNHNQSARQHPITTADGDRIVSGHFLSLSLGRWWTADHMYPLRYEGVRYAPGDWMYGDMEGTTGCSPGWM